MAEQAYAIPVGTVRAELRISNSRFVATLGAADSVAAARTFIADVRKEFSDASHNVYAYVIGGGATTTLGMSDDGEPGGTAGRPALAVLQGSGLGDAVVVVTRYFGGTLLGTGGLVRAYSDAVRAALELVTREQKIERRDLRLVLDYALYEQTRRAALVHGATILDESFSEHVELTLRLPASAAEPLLTLLRDLSAGAIRVR